MFSGSSIVTHPRGSLPDSLFQPVCHDLNDG